MRIAYRFFMFVCLFFFAYLLLSCSESPPEVALKPAPITPPLWSSQAIWYQIMVERFYNGDPSNDPSIETISGAPPGYVPSTWKITPWTQHWHTPDDYFSDVFTKPDMNERIIYHTDSKLALRRYGGDLQGVIDKLDYLESLGVNALYLNPINDAPSARKYDARFWHHVDVNFGPDPSGDIALIATEDTADPSTWHFTSADKLFLTLIQQAKARNIRIIIDYAWFHTGKNFWAWQQAQNNPQHSEFVSWYSANEVKRLGASSVDQDLPTLQTTFGTNTANEAHDGNIANADAKNHIMAVSRRWLDPNGDGDPQDGVDGFKLSYANKLPLGFWREYRIYVKSINPQAYLVGEFVDEQDSLGLFSSAQALKGDTFDALMHFDWFEHATPYFTTPASEGTATQFAHTLSCLVSNDASSCLGSRDKPTDNTVDDHINKSTLTTNTINMTANHNSPRLLTALSSGPTSVPNEKAFANNEHPQALPPTKNIINEAKLLLLQQFTLPGAPHIWAGDEMGMWGSYVPHNMKPLMWPEYSFEAPIQTPASTPTSSHAVAFNQALFTYYQFLVKLRRANPVLSSSNITVYDSGSTNNNGLLSYRRFDDSDESIYVVFNMGNKRQDILIPTEVVQAQSWLMWQSDNSQDIVKRVPSEQLAINAKSATLIIASH